MRTWLISIASDRALDGPLLLHGDSMLLTILIDEDRNGILDGVLTFTLEALDGVDPVHSEGDHDLDRLEVLLDLTEPRASSDTITDLSKRLEVPEFVAIERVGIGTSAEEDPFHLVEVILKSVIVLGEHPWTERDFEHVSFEGHGVTDTHSTRGFEDLSIGILPTDSYDFTHQRDSPDGDIAYLILSDRAVCLDSHEVGDDTFYTTFCCHVSLIIWRTTSLRDGGRACTVEFLCILCVERRS